MIDTKHLCPGCMERWEDTERPCPHCGFTWDKEQDHRAQPLFTILGGRYLLGQKIGSGGFGITYIAMDLVEEKKTAVKEFFPFSLSEREGENVVPFPGEEGRDFRKALRSFRKEGELLSRVKSIDGIVNYLDFVDEYGTSYLVMEYVEGQNLKQYMRQQEKNFTQEEALTLMRPILLAVDQLHQMNILHRDISPENLILKPDGTLTLVDLGAAREFRLDEEENLTVILKHGYAPEEQYHHGSRQGPWTDLYACCAVLYQMVSGILPQDAAERDKWDDLVPLDELKGVEVTEPFARAIEKGMSIDASLRYAAIPQLVADLYPPEATPEPKPQPESQSVPKLRWEKKEISSAGTKPSPQPEFAPEQKRKRWERVVVAVLAVALLLWYAFYTANYTKVESYVGWDIESAASTADDTLSVSQAGRVVDDSDDYGVVLEQSLSSGTTVKKNSVITLTYGVPDFEGMSWSDACDLAEELGIDMNKSSFTVSSFNFNVGTISSATYDSSGKTVSVAVVVPNFEGMSWSKASDLAEEQEVQISITSCRESGSETGTVLSAEYNSAGSAVSVVVAIPNLVGMDEDTAVSQLEAAFGQVEVEEATEYSDSVGKGKIIDYDVAVDGSSLLLYLTVSKGSEYVTVPDLGGMTPKEAQEALEAVGLVYAASDDTYYSTYEEGCVALLYGYDAGDTVRQGTTIWVALSKAKVTQSGLITADQTEITLTPGGDAVTIHLTTASSMKAGQSYRSTSKYEYTNDWTDSNWTCTVSADKDATSNGWIQFRVWPDASSRDNGDLPSDFINIRVYIEDS